MYLQITHSCFDFYSVQKVQKQKIHEANKIDDSDTKFWYNSMEMENHESHRFRFVHLLEIIDVTNNFNL